jgi:DNA-binding IclR family transcriptional regulator
MYKENSCSTQIQCASGVNCRIPLVCGASSKRFQAELSAPRPQVSSRRQHVAATRRLRMQMLGWYLKTSIMQVMLRR